MICRRQCPTTGGPRYSQRSRGSRRRASRLQKSPLRRLRHTVRSRHSSSSRRQRDRCAASHTRFAHVPAYLCRSFEAPHSTPTQVKNLQDIPNARWCSVHQLEHVLSLLPCCCHCRRQKCLRRTSCRPRRSRTRWCAACSRRRRHHLGSRRRRRPQRKPFRAQHHRASRHGRLLHSPCRPIHSSRRAASRR